jgi:hypothetical protein
VIFYDNIYGNKVGCNNNNSLIAPRDMDKRGTRISGINMENVLRKILAAGWSIDYTLALMQRQYTQNYDAKHCCC